MLSPRILLEDQGAYLLWVNGSRRALHPREGLLLHLAIAGGYRIRHQLREAGYRFWAAGELAEGEPPGDPFTDGEHHHLHFKRISLESLGAECAILRALGAQPVAGWEDPPPLILPDALDAIAVWEDEHHSVGLRAMAAAAAATIERALAKSRDPYIAFSGGKDSSAVLALVLALHPQIPIIWFDDELEFPETLDLMDAISIRYGDQFSIYAGASVHAGWFYPWLDEPFFREPLPGTIATPRLPDGFRKDGRLYLEEDLGFDCAFLGLRTEESRVRARHLAERGLIYRRGANRTLTCCPIAEWPDEAVRHCIEALGGPWNAAYDRMEEAGIERIHQRVGPLPLAFRRQLSGGWPELLTRLEARYGPRW